MKEDGTHPDIPLKKKKKSTCTGLLLSPPVYQTCRHRPESVCVYMCVCMGVYVYVCVWSCLSQGQSVTTWGGHSVELSWALSQS